MNILLRTCSVPGADKVLTGVRWMRSVPWWNSGGWAGRAKQTRMVWCDCCGDVGGSGRPDEAIWDYTMDPKVDGDS